MKRSVLILIGMVLLILNVHSQSLPTTSDSSTLIPNSQLRTALKLVEQGRYAKKQLEIEKMMNEILKERIANKDSVIQQLKEKDDIRKGINILTDKIIADKDKQLQYSQANVEELNRQLKKTNRKNWLTGGVGALGIIATILILK